MEGPGGRRKRAGGAGGGIECSNGQIQMCRTALIVVPGRHRPPFALLSSLAGPLRLATFHHPRSGGHVASPRRSPTTHLQTGQLHQRIHGLDVRLSRFLNLLSSAGKTGHLKVCEGAGARQWESWGWPRWQQVEVVQDLWTAGQWRAVQGDSTRWAVSSAMPSPSPTDPTPPDPSLTSSFLIPHSFKRRQDHT